jgi:hypothetical protein
MVDSRPLRVVVMSCLAVTGAGCAYRYLTPFAYEYPSIKQVVIRFEQSKNLGGYQLECEQVIRSEAPNSITIDPAAIGRCERARQALNGLTADPQVLAAFRRGFESKAGGLPYRFSDEAGQNATMTAKLGYQLVTTPPTGMYWTMSGSLAGQSVPARRELLFTSKERLFNVDGSPTQPDAGTLTVAQLSEQTAETLRPALVSVAESLGGALAEALAAETEAARVLSEEYQREALLPDGGSNPKWILPR